MASASCIDTPSNIRRLRAARLNFEAPSFSLGIETEAFRSIPSYDDFPENSWECSQEERNFLVSGSANNETQEKCSGRGEVENNSCEQIETVVVNDSEDDFEDFQISASQQPKRFKRLKRGPSSAWTPSQVARDLSRGTDSSARARRLGKGPSESSTEVHVCKTDVPQKTDIPARRKSQDLSKFSGHPYKEPLVFVKNSRNQVLEPSKGTGVEFTDFRQENGQNISGCRVRSSPSDYTSGQKESLLGSGHTAQCNAEIPKCGIRRENGSTEGGNRDLSSFQTDRINFFVSSQPSSRKDLEADKDKGDNEDDIEEFSDDEQFVSGFRTQRDGRRSLRPQMFGLSPILLPSSPEISKRPLLYIPGADVPVTASPAFSQPTEPATSEIINSHEDPFSINDFVSGSGWRRTKPNLSEPAQTAQHLNNSTSESRRAYSVPNLFKKSQQGLFRDTDLESIYTETPARKDVVGPSQVRNTEGRQTEQDRVQALLRQRFPHFKPVDALLVDGDLDNEPVYIDYRRQFGEGTGSSQLQSGNTSMGAGTRWPAVRSINGAFSAFPPSNPAPRRNLGKKKSKSKNQPKKPNSERPSSSAGRRSRAGQGGSAEGKWRTVNGSRVYIIGNERLSGRRAFSAYKKRLGKVSNKKIKKSTKPK